MQKKEFKVRQSKPVVICVFDKNSMKEYIKLQTILRKEGISTEIYPGESKLKKQMEYANKIKSPGAILFGEDEIKSGKPTLRNLSSGKEKSIEIEELVNEIYTLLNQDNSFKKVILMGHSYGGILVTDVLKHWNVVTPLEVHVIASPLLGMPMLINICDYEPIAILPNNSSLFEWRTQHQLDNAFKDLSEDPQQINIKGSIVTVLPDTYKGNRLGHNWSISWVVDEFFNSSTSI